MLTKIGLFLALLAYIIWGILSLYWKLFHGISAYALFSYRIIFTVLTMLIYMILSKKVTSYRLELINLCKDKRSLLFVVLASLMISINWLVYIFAVSHGLATQASLGYYILPLVSVGLALIFLKEQIERTTVLSLILAGLGVFLLTYNSGNFPYISLILALSFGCYGLLKKKIMLSSDLSMLIESLVVFPFALGYLLFSGATQLSAISEIQLVLLASSGLITVIPLLFFTEAVKRAPLNLVGFIQYINPTIQLIIAVFMFKEPIKAVSLQGFSLIWLAIAVFMIGQLKLMKK